MAQQDENTGTYEQDIDNWKKDLKEAREQVVGIEVFASYSSLIVVWFFFCRNVVNININLSQIYNVNDNSINRVLTFPVKTLEKSFKISFSVGLEL